VENLWKTRGVFPQEQKYYRLFPQARLVFPQLFPQLFPQKRGVFPQALFLLVTKKFQKYYFFVKKKAFRPPQKLRYFRALIAWRYA
jgi:hypothetical protein